MSDSRVPIEHRQAYADALKARMSKLGMTIHDVAEASGISGESIASYRAARAFPSPGYSVRVATALRSSKLRTLGSWTVPCDRCGRLIEGSSRGGHRRMYCSTFCRQKRRATRDKASPQAKAAKGRVYRQNTTLRQENTTLRDVIKANCMDCSMGTGICPGFVECRFLEVTELRRDKAATA